jgi:hypothetical protein
LAGAVKMWRLKSCPRCSGDMYIGKEHSGWYEQCLQCSYQRELQEPMTFHERSFLKEREPVGIGAAPANAHCDDQ